MNIVEKSKRATDITFPRDEIEKKKKRKEKQQQ